MTETTDNPALTNARFGDYLELTKPRLSALSVVTALVGYLAARPPFIFSELLSLMIGTSLAAGGVAVLNQWMEHDTDARMKRTSDRPIPTGKIPTGSAFVLGGLMCIAALLVVFVAVGTIATVFTFLTMACYLGWYTPAKRWSKLSTEIGALAGAFPPLIGWTAGTVNWQSALGWILFGILFFWQIPHFMAVSWMYRRDYAAVSFPMLPVRDESGVWVSRWSFVTTVALVIVSILPWYLGLASKWYLAATAVFGLWFLWRAIAFLGRENREAMARRLFFASIIYLPLQLGALVADRVAFFLMTINDIPAINASFNALSTVLICTGIILVRARQIDAHRRVMLAAGASSALFLVGYLAHKYLHGHTPFGGTGTIRTVYLTMLATHVFLAMMVAWMVPVTYWLALSGRIDRHRAWVKWTVPIWLYVSVTGVLVYFFLYQWWPVTDAVARVR